MDRQAIRDEVRRLVRDLDSYNYRWSDTVLNSRIDQAHERASVITKCVVSLNNLVNVVAGTSAYSIPTGFLEPIEIRCKSGDKWYALDKVRVEELNLTGEDWRSETGTPTKYYTLGAYINIYPIPDTSVASGMSIDMYSRPSAFSSDTDIPFSGDVKLYAFHDAISYEVAGKCKQDDGKFDEANQFLAIFQQKLREIKNQIASDTEDTRTPNVYEEERESSLR